jgi:hypothetical protein
LPETAPSALERYHPLVLRRQWWCDRWRETPCWLTSMVTHLALLLVIGSLATPPSRQPGMTTWILVLGSEDEHLAEADLVIVQMDDQKQDGGDRGELLEQPSKTPSPDDAVPPPPDEDAKPEPVPDEPAETIADHLPSPAAETTEPAPPKPPLLLASAVTPVDVAPQPPAEVLPSGGGPPPFWDNPWHEDVVARFIQYDIGNLRGAEGERARRDFEALGPHAVPALVRGLNQSASIQASCPVVVISSKLENALSQSGDQGMIRYAVDNIGRDVPENAPHLARLRALRDALIRTHLDRAEVIRQELAAQGIAASEQLAQQVIRYAQARPADLAAAFASPLPEERLAATLATSQLGFEPTPGQRSHLAAHLLLRLEDTDEAVRRHAESALAALLGVDPTERNRLAGDPFVFWRARREAFDRNHRLEAAARAMLSQAAALDRRGRRGPAAERYRRIVEEFPGSQAADQAAARLAAIGL